MPVTILPKTNPGKWSAILALAFLVLVLALEVSISFSVLFGPDLNHIASVALAIFFAGLGSGAFITGLISMIRNRERSILVFIGILITFWLGIGFIDAVFGLLFPD
jgi:cation transport ATPase